MSEGEKILPKGSASKEDDAFPEFQFEPQEPSAPWFSWKWELVIFGFLIGVSLLDFFSKKSNLLKWYFHELPKGVYPFLYGFLPLVLSVLVSFKGAFSALISSRFVALSQRVQWWIIYPLSFLFLFVSAKISGILHPSFSIILCGFSIKMIGDYRRSQHYDLLTQKLFAEALNCFQEAEYSSRKRGLSLLVQACNRNFTQAFFWLALSCQMIAWEGPERSNIDLFLGTASQEGNQNAKAVHAFLLASGINGEEKISLGFRDLQQLATDNIPIACRFLGILLYEKDGEENQKAAFEYSKVAYNGGFADTGLLLGEMYFFGRGVERNLDLAHQHLSLFLSEIFSLDACYLLGLVHLSEDSRCYSVEVGLSLLTQAAEKDHPMAALVLGKTYLLGLCGVKANNKEAEKWLSKAAELGVPDGEILLNGF